MFGFGVHIVTRDLLALSDRQTEVFFNNSMACKIPLMSHSRTWTLNFHSLLLFFFPLNISVQFELFSDERNIV